MRTIERERKNGWWKAGILFAIVLIVLVPETTLSLNNNEKGTENLNDITIEQNNSKPLGILPLEFQDDDQDLLDDQLEDVLLNTYAPVVFLNSAEDCWPCNVDWFLSLSHMRFHHNDCSDCGIIDHGYPNQQNIIEQRHRKKHGWPACDHYDNWEESWHDFDENHCFFLQVYNPTHTGIPPGDFGGHGSEQWITYGHAYPNNFDGINLQYWFFYAYNDGYLTGNHEGEWEHIEVELFSDFTVRDVVFYQHEGSQTMYDLTDMRWYETTHPVVLCALGSHASYPEEEDCNDHPNTPFPERDCEWCEVDVEDCPDAWFTWAEGKPSHAAGYQGGGVLNIGEKLENRQGHLNGQSFIHYSGRWGEIGETSFTSGPQGPAYHSNWWHNMGTPPTEPYHYLVLDKFPYYEAEEIPNHSLGQMSGAATAQMMLSYLFWDSNLYPEGPLSYSDQHSLFHRFHPGESGSITADEMAAGLNQEIDDRNHSWQYGYFFNAYSDSNEQNVLKQLCIWLYYPVDFYNENRPVDVPMPGHPNNVPCAVPILGSYTWWTAIRGLYTDCDPWESYPNFPSSITVHGFWVNDPYPEEYTVVPTYITASEWIATWHLPINGQYVAVIDPPSDIDSVNLPRYDDGEVSLASTAPQFSQHQTPLFHYFNGVDTNKGGPCKTISDRSIATAARSGVNDVLCKCDLSLAGVFSQSTATQVAFVTNDLNNQHYYLVIFLGNPTSFVVRISAQNGVLCDFSVIDKTDAEQYVKVFEGAHHLVYREGSPYYPDAI